MKSLQWRWSLSLKLAALPILLRLWSLSMYEFDFRHRLCQVCQVWKMGRGWMRWNLRGSLSHQLNAKSYKLLSMFQEIQTFISHSYVNMVNMNKLGIHVLFWFTEYQDYLCIACKKKKLQFRGITYMQDGEKTIENINNFSNCDWLNFVQTYFYFPCLLANKTLLCQQYC